MLKKLSIITFCLGIMVFFLYSYMQANNNLQPEYPTDNREISSSSGESDTSAFKIRYSVPDEVKKSIFQNKKILNILLIGTDTSEQRRKDGQLGFNTDSMILVTVNIETKRVLLTSVPRDIWIEGNKINALYILNGWSTLKKAYETITGQTIDGNIMIDFDGFRWLVDAFGGVPVNVQTTFTDPEFPKKDDSGTEEITFAQGYEKLTGERALSFARSRKGNNGEGSDLMRAKRQQLIIMSMVDAISNSGSQFWPMDVKKFFETMLLHTSTTLTLEDAYYLWDFYKNKSEYKIESFVVGDQYIYYPGMYPDSPYHAWVFVPRDDNWDKLHRDIEAKINGTEVLTSGSAQSTQ